MARRRIALVLPVYWPAVGGCELHTRELAHRLAQRHEVRIFTLIDSERDKHAHELWLAAILRAPSSTLVSRDGPVVVTRLGMRLPLKLLYAPLARVQSPRLPAALVAAAMAALAQHFRRQLRKVLTGADLVHAVHGGVSFLGYAALLAARDLGLPFIYTPLMHLPPGEEEAPLRLVPRSWSDPYWKKIWQQADALLAMTDFERRRYLREGVPPERVHRTGVGPMLADSPSAGAGPAAEADAPVVLFLGRHTLAKGVADLVEAAPLVWRRFPSARFVFAGPRTPETEPIFAAAADPRIALLGELSEADKARLIGECTVFCLPSRQESLGAAFLEAWYLGKPIVGLRTPTLEELSDGGHSGLLAEPNPKDIADKLMTLLSDPQLRQALGERGRRRVAERYAWGAIAARTEEIYEKAIAR